MPEGPLGRNRPSATDLADIRRGLEFLRATGPFDVGQAVVIAQNRILGVEAAEGTDHMLARFADVRRSGRIRIPAGTGVLVKAPKPDQDRRIDLPSIGPQDHRERHQCRLARHRGGGRQRDRGRAGPHRRDGRPRRSVRRRRARRDGAAMKPVAAAVGRAARSSMSFWSPARNPATGSAPR